jgi:hypothetical protein
MALTITDREMRSPDTRHTATAFWSVTWLPGRNLTRDEAITAMTIAEVVGQVPAKGTTRYISWLIQLEGWAAELGLSAATAIARSSEPPDLTGTGDLA